MKHTQPESNGWFDQLDELASRAEGPDPVHDGRSGSAPALEFTTPTAADGCAATP